MANPSVSPVARYVRRLTTALMTAEQPDGVLLERFFHQRDEAAFAALVRRHGPRVLGVCRRIVREEHAAEDCFQAVFLLLATRGGGLERPAALGPWLHGVATRVALKARGQAARRRTKERRAAVPVEAQAPPHDSTPDLRPVLDEAIAGLADKYRVPFVLCYIEERTVTDIARTLGHPRGTVAAHLARARQQLRRRLARRGVTLSATALAVALTNGAASAAVPPALAAETIDAATALAAGRAATAGIIPARVAALMEGVNRTMTVTRFQSSLLILTALLMGAVLCVLPAASAQVKDERPRPAPKAPADPGPLPARPGVVPAGQAILQNYEVVEIDKDGAERTISCPKLISVDGETAVMETGARLFLPDGTTAPLPVLPDGTTAPLQLRINTKATKLPNGKLRLDVRVEREDKVSDDADELRVAGTSLRCIRSVKEGETTAFSLPAVASDGLRTTVRVTARVLKE